MVINAEFKDIFFRHAHKIKIVENELSIDKNTILTNIKDIKQVTFEVTQDCNLRCKYCIFNSDAYPYHRKPSPLYMEFDNAKKVIDYIAGFISGRKNKTLSIGFYGGEPLLNFKFIEQMVELSKSIFYGWELIFTITTNGTRLTDTNIHFFIENHFRLLVSLDGPEKNHDSKRVFPDGTGSFRIIKRNLEKIKSINEKYFTDNVTFSAVFSRDMSLEKVYRFFASSHLVNKNEINFGSVSEAFTTYYDEFNYDRLKFQQERARIFERILNKIREKKKLSALDTDIVSDYFIMNSALKTRTVNHLSGTCVFDARLFVAADGSFHICEKMNDQFPIGSVEKGFDYPRMIDIVHEYAALVKETCFDCEARFLCKRCYARFARDGKFEINNEYCKNVRKSLKKRLEELVKLNEEGFNS